MSSPTCHRGQRPPPAAAAQSPSQPPPAPHWRSVPNTQLTQVESRRRRTWSGRLARAAVTTRSRVWLKASVTAMFHRVQSLTWGEMRAQHIRYVGLVTCFQVSNPPPPPGTTFPSSLPTYTRPRHNSLCNPWRTVNNGYMQRGALVAVGAVQQAAENNGQW